MSPNHYTEPKTLNSSCSRFKGKVAIVTASTEGIGFAIAKRLGEEGAHVVVSSRNEENVNNAVKTLKDLGCSVIGLTCHVSSEEDRKKLVDTTLETFGQIDIFVSNAAVNPHKESTLECSESVWDKIFEVNVKNAFQLTQLVVPHLKKTRGSITYISSVAGYHPLVYSGIYAISKTALFGLTKVMATELARDKIRVNCVAPGLIKTKFSELIYSSEEYLNKTAKKLSLGRIGVPDDIGGVVAFLASEDASYITGETVIAAGGLSSRL